MGLNKQSGNMYDFVTHTWNTIKGKCFHDCSYCYMKRFDNQKDIRFDEKELKTDLGQDNFIFVGSSNDMFADNIPDEWIKKTLDHCYKFDNKYLFQTKNPRNIRRILVEKSHVCVTIESNRYYDHIMRNSPNPNQRFIDTRLIRHPLYITIEPIMDFDLHFFLKMLESTGPIQVNIGAATGGHNLPEPPKEKILELIKGLKTFTKVHLKSNINRLIK